MTVQMHRAGIFRILISRRCELVRLFERYPEAKALFSRVKVDEPDSPEWRAHLLRIDNGIDIMVNLMDHDPAVLYEEVKHLGAQHAARDGMKAVYITVRQPLISLHLPA